MLKALVLSWGLGWALLACSSNGDTDACGGTVSGTYADSESLSAGSGACGPGVGGSGTITITGPGPDHEVTFPTIQGSCPATSKGCGLDVQCTIDLSDSSGNPTGSAKLTADWTFTSTGFTGQSTIVITKTDGTSCTSNFADTATKQ
jgi:hypothetical protein